MLLLPCPLPDGVPQSVYPSLALSVGMRTEATHTHTHTHTHTNTYIVLLCMTNINKNFRIYLHLTTIYTTVQKSVKFFFISLSFFKKLILLFGKDALNSSKVTVKTLIMPISNKCCM